jgi:N-acetylneuraminic acid mutarotase
MKNSTLQSSSALQSPPRTNAKRLHASALLTLCLLFAFAQQAHSQTTAPYEWTWVGGNITAPQAGVYGTLGVPAAANYPGGRSGAVTWTDSKGNFWLFAGAGDDASGTWGNLNDLWEYNPSTNEWTWISGSSTVTSPGVYGTLGTPAPGNIPGGRDSAVSWIDGSGNFWLFGGNGIDANGNGAYPLNDLWEFNPSTSEWTWMGGNSTFNAVQSGNDTEYLSYPAVYGTLGVPAAANTPGSRSGAVSWTDKSGNLWLFGGVVYVSYPNFGIFNDLWKFNPSTKEWAWMGGSSTDAQPGVYGALGTYAAGNIPASRESAVSWTDSSGNFWLFGGEESYTSA